MTIVESSIDRFRLDYLVAGAELPAGSTEEIRGYQARFDLATFDHPRLRRALLSFPMRDGTWTYFGVVHWDDGRDLDALDAIARSGAAPAGDELSKALGEGLFCQVRTVQCLACHDNSLVAVPDAGMPVVTVDRIRAHTFEDTCPTCGAERFVRYAELFAGG